MICPGQLGFANSAQATGLVGRRGINDASLRHESSAPELNGD